MAFPGVYAKGARPEPAMPDDASLILTDIALDMFKS